MSTVIELLGTFAQIADYFQVTDLDGNPTDAIEAGKTVVKGPWKVVTKLQIARVTGIVTESMYNATDKNGNRVYRFQGNGWCPEATAGDVLLQDVNNSTDRWACKPDLFGGTGWVGTATENLEVTYAKPGKPLLAMEVPAGTILQTLEGPRVIPEGAMLSVSKSAKGDFYVWTSDVVANYIRDYTNNN